MAGRKAMSFRCFGSQSHLNLWHKNLRLDFQIGYAFDRGHRFLGLFGLCPEHLHIRAE